MLTFEIATLKDCRYLFELRNEPDARRYFDNPDIVPYPEHREWFRESLLNPSRYIFIVKQDGLKVGMVRLDFMNHCEIHINIDKKYRNIGLGRKVIGEARIFRHLGIKHLIARIKPGNEASIKAFTYAGFVPKGQGVYQKELP